MMTASELADAIGRKNIADAAKVGPTAVSNAVVRGWFPATWFIVVSNLADRAGVECPPDLFKMVPLDNTQNVNCANENQEARQ